jgi:peptidyl-prolyl cis-trans isomerase D
VLQSMRSAAKYVWIVLIIAFVGGFLLVDSSGLLGRAPVTTNTVVATVNGEDILYLTWENAVANLDQQESERLGRGLTLDERRELEDRAFDELVNEILLRQEYERRGISVTDDEIRDAARVSPPPGVEQNPEFQTEGQFDLSKYQRFLTSPIARQQGLLLGLESFYRSEIPKQKLYDQIASDVWVSDARLWQLFRDRNDSAAVSFVAFRPDAAAGGSSSVTDADISAFYNKNKTLFERPGRAVVSLVAVERAITSADSAATRARIDALRAEIVAGASFADVAMRASEDSGSGAMGGELGRGTRGRFVPEFETAAYALKEGELSQPVLSPFGWHLIQVDRKRADTLDLRHILLRVQQSDSSAAATDRIADRLASVAAGSSEASAFDDAATELGLPVSSLVVNEYEPLNFAGRYVPGISAWAFSGVSVGESSDLQDAPEAYYVARLDSLRDGGIAPLADVKDDIRRRLEREAQIKALVPTAQSFATAARSGDFAAAAAAAGQTVETAGPFTRSSLVPGLGQFTEAVGAAFGLPTTGAVSDPVVTRDGVYVLRLDAWTPADSADFELMKPVFKLQIVQSLKSERVQQYVAGLRDAAKIKDDRKKIQATLRRQADVLL